MLFVRPPIIIFSFLLPLFFPMRAAQRWLYESRVLHASGGKANAPSCHHAVMSSCHHAVKDFGTQGERVMRLGVRHGLAMLRDNMGTGESNKKKRMEQPPEGSFHPPFFDSNQVPRD